MFRTLRIVMRNANGGVLRLKGNERKVGGWGTLVEHHHDGEVTRGMREDHRSEAEARARLAEMVADAESKGWRRGGTAARPSAFDELPAA